MKKPSRILIILLISLIASESYSQKLNKIYYGIVSDSISQPHYLEFKNDSVVEFKSIQRHMQPQSRAAFLYSKENGIITINSNKLKTQNAEEFNQYGFFKFSENIQLEIDGKALLDKKNKIVYVFLDDFSKAHYTTYIIDGEEFKQKNLIANSYGLVKKKMKMNRKLKKKLKTIKSDLEDENYNIVVYRGIDAYLKFGYDKVLGVIELNRK